MGNPIFSHNIKKWKIGFGRMKKNRNEKHERILVINMGYKPKFF